MNKQHESYANADTSQYFKSDSDDRIQISSAGFEFDTSDRKWVLDSETTVYVGFAGSYPQEYQESIIKTLAHFAITCSAKYVSQHISELKRFLKHEKGFTLAGLMAYKMLTPESTRDQCISVLRCFLRKMVYLGFYVSDKFMKEFNTWVLRGREKGVPVLSQDPEDGPYSDLEFRAIQSPWTINMLTT